MFSLIASLVLLANTVTPSSVQRYRGAIEEFRANRQQALDEIRQNREELREKLSEIRDERKQKIIENLAERIVNVNNKWVEHWNNVLERLSGILAKIEVRLPDTDTSAAEAAIASAQEAVNTQAGKTYDIAITDEETLGENVSEVLREFHGDLREVHALVKTAREEVVKALRNLKASESEEEDEE